MLQKAAPQRSETSSHADAEQGGRGSYPTRSTPDPESCAAANPQRSAKTAMEMVNFDIVGIELVRLQIDLFGTNNW